MDPKRVLVGPLADALRVLDGALTAGSISNARDAVKSSQTRTAALQALDANLGYKPVSLFPERQGHRHSA